jgi:hypothetical protein
MAKQTKQKKPPPKRSEAEIAQLQEELRKETEKRHAKYGKPG